MTTPPLPEQIELHRDRMWRRDEDLRVESAFDAERFIEDVGFANALTDARRAGPSLYIAVCGRRDVSLPRNVQKNEETSASPGTSRTKSCAAACPQSARTRTGHSGPARATTQDPESDQ